VKHPTLYLIDISSFIFRAFFAIRPLHTPQGEPTNAVYGVATVVARRFEEAKPEFVAVTYDSKEPSFRKVRYAEYKANRSAPPDDLIPQFDRIEQLVRLMELPSFRQSGVEADDLIASAAKQWCLLGPDHRVVVVSGDKDLMQLVDKQVSVWDTMAGKHYGPDEVREKFGVGPEQLRDYLGLVGDSSDNIPGVPSIGPKTASDLLSKFKNLENILQAALDGKIEGKKGEAIRANVENARLSQELATLKHDLKINVLLDDLRYSFQVTQGCADFLEEMNFSSLLAKWRQRVGAAAEELQPRPLLKTEPAPMPAPGSAAQMVAGAALPAGRFRMATSAKDLQEILREIEDKKEFGFDLETTSLNPREAELVGISLCMDPVEAWYIPVGHIGTPVEQLPVSKVLDALRPYLEDPRYKKIGQNLKYDWSVLYTLGLKPNGIGADTMVAAYVLDPENRVNMATLAERYLSYKILTFEEVCGKGANALTFDQVPVDVATRYSAEDAWITWHLWRKLQPEISRLGLMEIFARVDLPLVDVLARMECQGVCIDTDWLKQLSVEFEKDLRRIEERVGAYTNGPINLNSPKQLGHLLFDQLKLPVQSKTKTGYSTDASVLEVLAPLHEVPRLLLEYREVAKLKGTYVDPLPLLRDRKTGKIHASFHQCVTATGRLSSSDPNLQNIPVRTDRGRKIRRAFVPSPGCVLLSADYSQIELRLLAHMSGDKELCASFQRDEDVHRRTASEIFGIAPEQVSDQQRGVAKAINFGLMYGKTAFGLAQELGIPRREAQQVIDRYFARYRGVKKFLDDQIELVRERGVSLTVLGRRRALPDIHSKNAALRANAERMAMNSPIQGTAADLMKLAMNEIEARLEQRGFGAKLIIQVHDEVLLDCPKAEVERVLALVTDAMEKAMDLNVPLRVNAGQGPNWMEL